jgi:inward rectifier potassium channel
MATASPQPSFDPGFTQQYSGALLRAINKDGSFNIRRRGYSNLSRGAYLHMVGVSWPRFLAGVAGCYLIVNFVFAGLYLALGPDALHASERDLGLGTFGRAFFFSVHTLTTVGYGALYPYGFAANLVAAVEAALGLMGFALATGVLYGRFSRPSARLVFSEKMIVAPFRDASSLQFRVANQRSNVLMDLDADMVLMTVESDASGQLKRNFTELRLERSEIYFLALTWTLVHPLDQSSPLWGKSAADLERLQAEVMILIKGYDDSFSQVVHTRYSYRWDEMEWSVRFAPAFEVAPEGHLVLDVSRVGEVIRI